MGRNQAWVNVACNHALNMALARRFPHRVVHHSDKGSQYTSLAFSNGRREMGVVTSTGTAGDRFDNAIAENFFATLECELTDRRCFRAHVEARMAIFEFLEGSGATRKVAIPPSDISAPKTTNASPR